MTQNEPIGRFRFMNEQRVNLDGFATPAPELGLVAFNGLNDPSPSIAINAGRIVEMDGRSESDFDSIDEFIARHGIDLTVAQEAMAIDSTEFARRLVDPNHSRKSIVRLASGMTPAKLAEVLSLLSASELVIAMTKMRARRTPSNQAHVTNRSDDPLLLAADAATAAASPAPPDATTP